MQIGRIRVSAGKPPLCALPWFLFGSIERFKVSWGPPPFDG